MQWFMFLFTPNLQQKQYKKYFNGFFIWALSPHRKVLIFTFENSV